MEGQTDAPQSRTSLPPVEPCQHQTNPESTRLPAALYRGVFTFPQNRARAFQPARVLEEQGDLPGAVHGRGAEVCKYLLSQFERAEGQGLPDDAIDN